MVRRVVRSRGRSFMRRQSSSRARLKKVLVWRALWPATSWFRFALWLDASAPREKSRIVTDTTASVSRRGPRDASERLVLVCNMSRLDYNNCIYGVNHLWTNLPCPNCPRCKGNARTTRRLSRLAPCPLKVIAAGGGSKPPTNQQEAEKFNRCAVWPIIADDALPTPLCSCPLRRLKPPAVAPAASAGTGRRHSRGHLR